MFSLNKILRPFSSHNKDAKTSVLTDIEQGGTFDARKRVPKIITKELRSKIKDHVSSSSSGEYLFSSLRRKNMLKDSVTTDPTTFTSSFNNSKVLSPDGSPPVLNGFKTQAQGDRKVAFSGQESRHNLSDFVNKVKTESKFSTSRALSTKLKKIVSKFSDFRNLS